MLRTKLEATTKAKELLEVLVWHSFTFGFLWCYYSIRFSLCGKLAEPGIWKSAES